MRRLLCREAGMGLTIDAHRLVLDDPSGRDGLAGDRGRRARISSAAWCDRSKAGRRAREGRRLPQPAALNRASFSNTGPRNIPLLRLASSRRIPRVTSGVTRRPWYRQRRITRADEGICFASFVVALFVSTWAWSDTPWWHVWASAAIWAGVVCVSIEARHLLSRDDD